MNKKDETETENIENNCVNEAAWYYVIKKEPKAATIKQPVMRIGIRAAMRLPIEAMEAGTLDQPR